MNKKVLVGIAVFLLLLGGAVFVANPDILGGKLRRIGTKKAATEDKEKKKKGTAEKKPEVKPVAAPTTISTPISAIIKEAELPALTSAPPVSATPPLPDIETVARQYFTESAVYQKQNLDLLTQILAAVKNPAVVPIYTPSSTSPQPPPQPQPPIPPPSQEPPPPPAPEPPPPPPPPPAPTPTPTEPGLIGYFSFDDMEANIIKDSSGMQHEAETKGDPKAVAGKVGQALEFDGVDDYVTLPILPEIAQGKNVSLEFWVNPVESNQRGHIVYVGQWAVNGFGLEQSNSTCGIGSVLAAIAHNTACDLIGADFVLKTDQWIHAVLTRGDNKWKIYVNGELKKVGGQSDPKEALENITIGAGAATFGGEAADPFKGLIDEVKIYNRELKSEEIKTKYQSVQKDLLGYWNFDNPKNLLIDNGGSGNTAEWVGEPKPVGGTFGNALEFDGKSAVAITLPKINTAKDTKVTVLFWMKWTGQSQQMPFGFQQYDLYFNPSNPVTFGFNTGVSDLWGKNSDGLANQWVHVAAEFINGDLQQNKLYLNGVEQTLSAITEKIGKGTITTNAYIGSWRATESYKFKGQIDEVKIYNRALTPEEVKAEYEG